MLLLVCGGCYRWCVVDATAGVWWMLPLVCGGCYRWCVVG